MHKSLPAITLLLACALFASSAFAQTSGDYRSAVNNGNWGTAATWEVFNGAAWESASAAPSSANNVTIRNGFNVVLDASGKYCLTLTIDSGATFRTGVALPTSSIRYVRVTGPTVIVNGAFGDTTGTGDAIAIENANDSGTVTITGAGLFAPSRLRVNSGVSNTTTVLDIDARFMYTGSTGTGGVALYPQTDGNTFVVSAGKAVRFANYASVAVGSSASSASGQSVTYAFYGDVDLSGPNSSLNLKSQGAGKAARLLIGEGASLAVGKDLLTSLAADGAKTEIEHRGSLTVNGVCAINGAAYVLMVGAAVIQGSGTCAVDSGAHLMVGHALGLDGAFQQSGGVTLSKQAQFAFGSDAPQVTGALMPDTVLALRSANKAGLALSASVAAGTVEVDSACRLSTSAGDTLRIMTRSEIRGTLANEHSIDANDTLVFRDGARYLHAVNGDAVPPGAWQEGSVCEFTGITTAAPSGGNQDFHHVIWDCPSQTANLNLGWNGNTIRGDITVVSTGSGRWQFCAPPAGTATERTTASVTMNGRILQTGGNLTSNGTSAGFTDITIHTMGPVEITGGNFSVSRGSQGGTGTTSWYLHDDLTMSGATTQNSNGAGARFIFAKQGVQQLRFGAGNTMTAFPVRLQAGTTLDLDTCALAGSGSVVVDSGAILITRHAQGLNGNVKSSGAVQLSTQATYAYEGTEGQVTGTLLPDTVYGLVVKNAFGVALSKQQRLNGVLKLEDGKLMLGPHGLSVDTIDGATASRYVVTNDSGALTMYHAGSGATHEFPVGTHTYSPLKLMNAGSADQFRVRVQNSVRNAANDTGKTVRRMWTIREEVAGGTQAQVTLMWNAGDEAPGFARGDTVVLGKHDGTGWTEMKAAVSGTGPYEASVGNVTSFSDWAIGNIGSFTGSTVSAGGPEADAVPQVLSLSQNYPNPFNPTTTIRVDNPMQQQVSLMVYDILGREVAVLLNRELPAGFHNVPWDGSSMPSGLYVYVLRAGGEVRTRSMVLLK